MRSLSLRARLLSCLGALLLAAACVSAYSLRAIHGFRSVLRDEIELGSARLDQARQITIGLTSMRSALRGITVFSLAQNPQGVATAKSAFETSAAEIKDVPVASLTAG